MENTEIADICENELYKKAQHLSSVALAFLGDAVFSLFVRDKLVLKHDFKSNFLTKLNSKFVSAKYQSVMFNTISPLLSEAELAVAKRARNTHTTAKAKNAALSDYKRATALEALFGYLHITKQNQRLEFLENECYNAVEKEITDTVCK